MKNFKIKEELKSLSKEQLEERVHVLSRELFAIKLQSKVSHVKDVSCFAKYRKNLARIKTLLRLKELGKDI